MKNIKKERNKMLESKKKKYSLVDGWIDRVRGREGERKRGRKRDKDW